MNKLLLVDGSNLLFQMFYGMPSRIVNSNGKPIHGTLGFTGALLKIIRKVSPTHIAVLFDGEHGTERNELDPDYKANRPDFSQMEEEETPFSQLNDIYAVLDRLNIRHWETSDCEVDDWISAYTSTYGQDTQIFIMSFDSDFFQLIGDNVSVIRYRGDSTVIWTPQHIKERFGILPEQYADMKSLTGDTSDNIKGVHGVGIKTAAKLLAKFEDIENLLSNANLIEKPALRTVIKENSERIEQNYRLIKLNGDCKIPFELDELQYSHKDVTSTAVLKESGVL